MFSSSFRFLTLSQYKIRILAISDESQYHSKLPSGEIVWNQSFQYSAEDFPDGSPKCSCSAKLILHSSCRLPRDGEDDYCRLSKVYAQVVYMGGRRRGATAGWEGCGGLRARAESRRRQAGERPHAPRREARGGIVAAGKSRGVDSALLPSCLSDTSSSIHSHSSNHNFLTNININLRGVNNSDHRFTD